MLVWVLESLGQVVWEALFEVESLMSVSTCSLFVLAV